MGKPRPLRLRALFWRVVEISAALALVYGVWTMVEFYGWRGLAASFAAAVLGWMAVNMLYPLWFGGSR